MKNMLFDWLSVAKTSLERQGYSVWVNEAVTSQESACVNLDGKDFVGGITYWKPDLFEFQFNSFAAGEIILLETVKLGSVGALNAYVMHLLSEKLPA